MFCFVLLFFACPLNTVVPRYLSLNHSVTGDEYQTQRLLNNETFSLGGQHCKCGESRASTECWNIFFFLIKMGRVKNLTSSKADKYRGMTVYGSICFFFLCLPIFLFPLISAKGPGKGRYSQLRPCFPLSKRQFHLGSSSTSPSSSAFLRLLPGPFTPLFIVSLLASALFIQVTHLLSAPFTQSAALLFWG